MSSGDLALPAQHWRPGVPGKLWGLTTVAPCKPLSRWGQRAVSLRPPTPTNTWTGDVAQPRSTGSGGCELCQGSAVRLTVGLSWPGRGAHQVPIIKPGAKACRTPVHTRMPSCCLHLAFLLQPSLQAGVCLPLQACLPFSQHKHPSASPQFHLSLLRRCPISLPSHPHPDIPPPHPPFLSLPPPSCLTGPLFSCLHSENLNEKVVH